MATAVTIEAEAKARLEELQAEIRLRTGESVSQEELLTRLIDDAYESREAVIDSFRGSTVPLSATEKKAMQQGRLHSGTETEESDIDCMDDDHRRHGRGLRRSRRCRCTRNSL